VLGLLECDSVAKDNTGAEDSLFVDREQIAETAVDFLTRLPAPTTPRKLSFSPTKLSSPTKPASPGKQDAPIVRTLRTTLSATSPTHSAHGPVWGLCVLAGLIVLLGGRVAQTGLEGGKVGRVVSSLAALGMAHARSSVRALACLMWRGMGWGWFVATGKNQAREGVDAWWKIVLGNVELSTGTCVVGGLVNAALEESQVDDDEEEETGGKMKCDAEDLLRKAVIVLDMMVKKDEKTCKDAIDTLKQLVGAGKYRSRNNLRETDCESDSEGEEDSYDHNETAGPWDPSVLIPRALFVSIPALMAIEFTSLTKVLHPIFLDRRVLRDVRMLGRTEIMRGWGCAPTPTSQPSASQHKAVDASMWEGLVGIWRACLSQVGEFTDARDTEIPREKDLVAVWEGLVSMGVGYFQGTYSNIWV
jgi:hypothetical protein